MVTVITKPATTFHEYALLPGYTPANCSIPTVSLETRLAQNIVLGIPFLSAAMTSVTGYDMVLALGKEGGMGVLPARLSIDTQADIVRRAKNYQMHFVDRPTKINANESIEAAVKLVERHGHSKIPVVDDTNVYKGMFVLQEYWKMNVRPEDAVTSAMIPLGDERILYVKNPELSVAEVKKLFAADSQRYIVVVDKDDRLVKLAFKKDIENINVGAAISTHEGWQERVDANIHAGVDLIVVDTSDAHSEHVDRVLTAYVKNKYHVPICVGNVVTYEAAKHLMELGADIVKFGMSSGSICTTQREKAVGRSPMTAVLETARARDTYHHESSRYVPIIMDGGIATAADMIIALTCADALMMGGYFNHFYEAAGEKRDERGAITRDEHEMLTVDTWGEGSERAQNLGRYGHATLKTFFPEGIDGTVPYNGRLKPNVKRDLLKIKAALVNVGSMNLVEFRNAAVIELMSLASEEVVSRPHHVATNP